MCTYGQLRDQTRRWAATLAARGVGPDQTVALADWGGVRSTAVTLAAARLGAATAQMNPLLTSSELAQLVAVSGVRHRWRWPTRMRAAAMADALGPDGVVLAEPDVGPGGLDDRRPGWAGGGRRRPDPVHQRHHRAAQARRASATPRWWPA